MAETGIIRYDPSMRKVWDSFISSSKNGTFLFMRGYMDYHSDRFPDHSLIFTRNGKPCAVLPATGGGGTFASHSGLTYGGIVTDRHATTAGVLEIFNLLKDYLPAQGFRTFIYKPVPYIYHTLPADEDLYALFRTGGTLIGRGVSSSILQTERLRLRNIRLAGIRKALNAGVTVEGSSDFQRFWEILCENLSTRHATAPVHSLDEIMLLSSRFPDEIKLYVAKKGGSVIAGVVMYLTKTVAHAQYIASSPEGRKYGALDLLFKELIDKYCSGYTYFDFGISTENGGLVLNESLLYQKEGFGGRAVCYDTYEIPLPS